MKRAALYVRVSSGAQRDNYSPESQLALASEYAAGKGYTVADGHVFNEVWTAKASGDLRPELQRLKAAIVAGHVEVVIALKADRMFRDILDGMVFAQFLRSNRARLEFVLEGNDDSPLGIVMYGLKLYGAETQWEAIREATQRGMMARIKAGKPRAGKKPLFGYRWADEATKERLTIFEPEAEVVRRIYRHLAGGGSLASLDAQLRAEGIRGPSGGYWTATTLGRLIRNDWYAGRAFANRWQTFKNEQGRRDQRLRPREDWIALPDGVAPAIVEPGVWDSAVAQIERNRATEGPRNLRNPESFLLRGGYARCGLCGGPMAAKNRDGREPSYQCARNVRPGMGGHCPGTYIRAAELDLAVWDRVTLVLGHPDWVKGYLADQADTAVIDADLAAVESQLKAMGQRQTRWVRNLGLVDEDADYLIRQELATLKEQKTRLQAEYHSISARRVNLTKAEDFVDRLIARAATVGAMTYAERRAILSEFGVSATVFPVSAESRWTADMAFDLDAWIEGDPSLQGIEGDSGSAGGGEPAGFGLPTFPQGQRRQVRRRRRRDHQGTDQARRRDARRRDRRGQLARALPPTILVARIDP